MRGKNRVSDFWKYFFCVKMWFFYLGLGLHFYLWGTIYSMPLKNTTRKKWLQEIAYICFLKEMQEINAIKPIICIISTHTTGKLPIDIQFLHFLNLTFLAVSCSTVQEMLKSAKNQILLIPFFWFSLILNTQLFLQQYTTNISLWF